MSAGELLFQQTTSYFGTLMGDYGAMIAIPLGIAAFGMLVTVIARFVNRG